MKIVFRLALSVVAALAIALPAIAQVTTGSMAGKVLNAKQEGVGDENVIAIHLPSGTSYEATTRADGTFVIVGMQNYLAEAGEWVLVIQGVIFVVVVLAFRRGIVGEVAPRLARLMRSGDQPTDTPQAARLTSDAR